MSSHHVIRDEQEPPVLILDDSFDMNVLDELLGWAPLVWIDHQLLKWFKARKTKIDGLIYKVEESIEMDRDETVNYPVYAYREDEITQFLFKLAHQKDFTAINVFCNNGRKALIIEQLKQRYSMDLPINIFSSGGKTIISNKKEIRKWYPDLQKLDYKVSEVTTDPALKKSGSYHEIPSAGIYKFVTKEVPLILTEL